MAPATDQNEKKRLSYASAQYDVEQKGHLTKDQQMLRDLDLDGDGKLDVNELQPFVERHNELLKENAKVKRNQIILLCTTILFGIATVVASLLAARASQLTTVGDDGLLASKDTGLPIVTQSKGVTAIAKQEIDYETGEEHTCVSMQDVDRMVNAFADGSNIVMLTDSSEVDLEETAFKGERVTGSTFSSNTTHTELGGLVLDTSEGNPCEVNANRRLEFDSIIPSIAPSAEPEGGGGGPPSQKPAPGPGPGGGGGGGGPPSQKPGPGPGGGGGGGGGGGPPSQKPSSKGQATVVNGYFGK